MASVIIAASIDIPNLTGELLDTFVFTSKKNSIYRITGAIIAPGSTIDARVTAMLSTEFLEDAFLAALDGDRRTVRQVLIISPVAMDVYLWANSPDYTQFNKYRIKALIEEMDV
jgi:hypothetical protein